MTVVATLVVARLIDFRHWTLFAVPSSQDFCGQRTKQSSLFAMTMLKVSSIVTTITARVMFSVKVLACWTYCYCFSEISESVRPQLRAFIMVFSIFFTPVFIGQRHEVSQPGFL